MYICLLLRFPVARVSTSWALPGRSVLGKVGYQAYRPYSMNDESL